MRGRWPGWPCRGQFCGWEAMRARIAVVRSGLPARGPIIAILIAVASMGAALGAAAISVAATSHSRSTPARLTPALKRALSANVNQRVIVIMKGQLAPAIVGTRAWRARASAIRADGAAKRQLRQVHATEDQKLPAGRLVLGDRLEGRAGEARGQPDGPRSHPGRDDLARQPRRDSLRGAGRTAHAAQRTTTLSPNTIPGACSSNPQRRNSTPRDSP